MQPDLCQKWVYRLISIRAIYLRLDRNKFGTVKWCFCILLSFQFSFSSIFLSTSRIASRLHSSSSSSTSKQRLPNKLPELQLFLCFFYNIFNEWAKNGLIYKKISLLFTPLTIERETLRRGKSPSFGLHFHSYTIDKAVIRLSAGYQLKNNCP